jgi:hypothetical protein
LETEKIFGYPFVLWRGLPIIPTEKIPVDKDGITNILLVRLGLEEQGIVGLINNKTKEFVVRDMGIDDNNVSKHLVTLYYSIVVLSQDALGCLTCKI